MKKMVFLALALGLCVSSALAAGTASDPLITASYIDEELRPSLAETGEALAESGLRTELSALLTAAETQGSSFAYGYEPLYLPAGSGVALLTGASAILESGSASIAASSGTLIEINHARELTQDAMTPRLRYFCAEDTAAEVIATVKSLILVNGDYRLVGSAAPAMTAYRDVRVADWFYEYAAYVREKRLYHDVDETAFRPNEEISRAELVHALWSAAGSPRVARVDFTDVPEDAWFAEAVSWAAAHGVVNGYGDGRFGPLDSLTREQTAAIMYRDAEQRGETLTLSADLSGYEDAGEIASWAQKEMSWANARGLIKGMTATRLAPKGTATRAELATIIMRFLEEKA